MLCRHHSLFPPRSHRPKRCRRCSPPPPPIQEKEKWFDYWDEDDSGELDLEEAVRALAKTFGLSDNLAKLRTIRDTVSAVWTIFDTDGGGGIDKFEFVQPDGLADTIIASVGSV
jgi:hypothetical protein